MDEGDVAADLASIYHDATLRSVLAAAAASLKGSSTRLQTGICRKCNDAIEPARLEANPQARECVFCAREAEEHARRRGD